MATFIKKNTLFMLSVGMLIVLIVIASQLQGAQAQGESTALGTAPAAGTLPAVSAASPAAIAPKTQTATSRTPSIPRVYNEEEDD